MKNLLDFFKQWTSVFSAIIAIITTSFAFYSQFKVDKLQDDLKQIELANKESDLLFKLYEKVQLAMNEADSNKINFTRTIIFRSVKNDTIKNELLIALSTNKAASKSLKIEGEILREFESQNLSDSKPKTEPQKASISPIKIDVFYVEATQLKSENKAKKIINKLIKQGYNPRLRKLPSIVNQRSGYNITSSQIRFEENEKEFATEIANNLSSEIILDKHPATMSTPNYISIFIY